MQGRRSRRRGPKIAAKGVKYQHPLRLSRGRDERGNDEEDRGQRNAQHQRLRLPLHAISAAQQVWRHGQQQSRHFLRQWLIGFDVSRVRRNSFQFAVRECSEPGRARCVASRHFRTRHRKQPWRPGGRDVGSKFKGKCGPPYRRIAEQALCWRAGVRRPGITLCQPCLTIKAILIHGVLPKPSFYATPSRLINGQLSRRPGFVGVVHGPALQPVDAQFFLFLQVSRLASELGAIGAFQSCVASPKADFGRGTRG